MYTAGFLSTSGLFSWIPAEVYPVLDTGPERRVFGIIIFKQTQREKCPIQYASLALFLQQLTHLLCIDDGLVLIAVIK